MAKRQCANFTPRLGAQRVSDEALIAAYKRAGTVKGAGALVGIHGSSVHERLQRLGAIPPRQVWPDENDVKLREVYDAYVSEGRLQVLADQFGIRKTSLCAHARRLGLTNHRRARPYSATWKYVTLPEAEKAWVKFKKSKLGLIAYCKKHGIDDLGFSVAMKRFFSDEWDAVLELKSPKGSLYRRGRAFEYIVRDYFKERGYFVMRSPASKSPIDVLAVQHGRVVMVQCKRHGALSVTEWNTLLTLAQSVGAMPVLASFESGRGSLRFFELVDFKDGSKRKQPMREVPRSEFEVRVA